MHAAKVLVFVLNTRCACEAQLELGDPAPATQQSHCVGSGRLSSATDWASRCLRVRGRRGPAFGRSPVSSTPFLEQSTPQKLGGIVVRDTTWSAAAMFTQEQSGMRVFNPNECDAAAHHWMPVASDQGLT